MHLLFLFPQWLAPSHELQVSCWQTGVLKHKSGTFSSDLLHNVGCIAQDHAAIEFGAIMQYPIVGTHILETEPRIPISHDKGVKAQNHFLWVLSFITK